MHERECVGSPLLVGLGRGGFLELDGTIRGDVVGIGAKVTVDSHESVTLEVEDRATRLVDRDLLVIDAETMTVGIWVGEETRLQNGVGRRLDTWNQMGGREGGLLDFGKVVDRVLVECHLSEFAHWDLTVWPDFGQVKDVPAELLGLFGGQNLYEACPGREVARFNSIEEILCGVVGILTGEFTSGIVVEVLDSLVDDPVELDIIE